LTVLSDITVLNLRIAKEKGVIVEFLFYSLVRGSVDFRLDSWDSPLQILTISPLPILQSEPYTSYRKFRVLIMPVPSSERQCFNTTENTLMLHWTFLVEIWKIIAWELLACKFPFGGSNIIWSAGSCVHLTPNNLSVFLGNYH
jgi:hypothetical protein